MHPEESLPLGVEVIPAAPAQESVLANLLELYAHDFSEFLDLQLRPDGRFGYPKLSRYWQEENRFPFLVKVEGQLAGFVLVSRGSQIREAPEVWDMAEFFIVRRYRRQGVGAAVAQQIWRRFPGAWEVRVLESNEPARRFWAAAIRTYTGSLVEEASAEVEAKRWRVFFFDSPAAVGEAT